MVPSESCMLLKCCLGSLTAGTTWRGRGSFQVKFAPSEKSNAFVSHLMIQHSRFYTPYLRQVMIREVAYIIMLLLVGNIFMSGNFDFDLFNTEYTLYNNVQHKCLLIYIARKHFNRT